MLEYKQFLKMLAEASIEKLNLMGLYNYKYTELKFWIKYENYFFVFRGHILENGMSGPKRWNQ